MSGLEIAGLAVAVPALVAQLVQISKAGYDLFQNARDVPTNVQTQLYSMNVSRVQLEDWDQELSRCKGGLTAVIDPVSLRYRLVLETLILIAGVFSEVRQLEEKYGISCVVENDPDVERVGPVEEVPARKERRFSRATTKMKNYLSKSKLASENIHPTSEKPLASTTLSTLAETSLAPTSDWYVAKPLDEIDLDSQIHGIDEYVQQMGAKAAEYQRTIPELRKYQWAYSSGEKLRLLIVDLETYISKLQVLTKVPFSRLNTVVPVPFDEFVVESNLPFARLENFSGREDILEDVKICLSSTSSEKGRLCKRGVVVLQGMGGIGKSQIALEYLYRNIEDYTAVFWIDATNPSTVEESGRGIMGGLIAHYAKKHRGGLNFADIAIDLGIPGQITNEGFLSDQAASAAWTSVRKWLTRDGNSGWCLVIDGFNIERDTERMQGLLPSSAYGHIIATSRVSVPGYKCIDIPVLDKESGLKLLLNDQTEADKPKLQRKAEQIADLLGYLPLALAQAAAFVKKMALSLTIFLERLRADLTRYVSSPFPPYKAGVYSCWELSITALMESTPHAFDLLRVCSFLSPDGISRELLYRGLAVMDWFQNDESRLDDALDNLVMYALMKRRYSNTDKGDMFSIHPVIQRLAQQTDIEGSVVVLVTALEKQERLRKATELKAISVVGYGLKVLDREAYEWVYERRNMGHISLCLDKYLIDCDQELQDGIADAKLAKALKQFSGLKLNWGFYPESERIAKRSIEIYERALLAGRDSILEAELLMAKQGLLDLWVIRRTSSNMTEIGILIDEVLSRQSAILRPDHTHLLWTQALKAQHYSNSGRKLEAVQLFGECVEKNRKALQPGDAVNIGTISSLALVYDELGMYEEAAELYQTSLELYWTHRGMNHMHTHVSLGNIALFKAERGDHEAALTYFKLLAEGCESTYGLANPETIEALMCMAFFYRQTGCKEEADRLDKEIAKAKKILDTAEEDNAGGQ
ncbi:hypothetical protein K505DRAFT_315276 [Melanomma pulvis-pyrius CBS 109.77]|uniref:Uncharacterized protein n=1 Tax=Melanomma pulvis-pyrius CBS 109.77 TaxID=1314802 RepID=A0A6A6WWE3_9PLEO|nr:hypothetical protein K505DRAFT_315276 [Melanomma pulvis-pyrius CBS 109.77]